MPPERKTLVTPRECATATESQLTRIGGTVTLPRFAGGVDSGATADYPFSGLSWTGPCGE